MRHALRSTADLPARRFMRLALSASAAAAVIIGLARPASGAAAPPEPLLPLAPEVVAPLSAGPVVPTGCWKLVVTPDTAAVMAGRSEFHEYVNIETKEVTAQEMARLGFEPKAGTLGTNAAGQTTFTVTLISGSHGTATWSGTFAGASSVSG